MPKVFLQCLYATKVTTRSKSEDRTTPCLLFLLSRKTTPGLWFTLFARRLTSLQEKLNLSWVHLQLGKPGVKRQDVVWRNWGQKMCHQKSMWNGSWGMGRLHRREGVRLVRQWIWSFTEALRVGSGKRDDVLSWVIVLEYFTLTVTRVYLLRSARWAEPSGRGLDGGSLARSEERKVERENRLKYEVGFTWLEWSDSVDTVDTGEGLRRTVRARKNR